MPTDLFSAIFLLGRVLLGGAFVVAGVRNFMSLDKLTGLMASRGVPMAGPVTLAGVTAQTVCGALVVLGILTPWAALGEAVFIIAATAIVHPYWTYPVEERFPHVNAVISNTALTGAFLLLAGMAA